MQHQPATTTEPNHLYYHQQRHNNNSLTAIITVTLSANNDTNKGNFSFPKKNSHFSTEKNNYNEILSVRVREGEIM